MEMDDDAMFDLREVREYFGGKRSPLSASTIYRWVKAGKLAKPVIITSKNSRWRRSDCKATRDKIMAEQNGSAA
jgi:predicted DNA-binding transcriptional regulator AlpA